MQLLGISIVIFCRESIFSFKFFSVCPLCCQTHVASSEDRGIPALGDLTGIYRRLTRPVFIRSLTWTFGQWREVKGVEWLEGLWNVLTMSDWLTTGCIIAPELASSLKEDGGFIYVTYNMCPSCLCFRCDECQLCYHFGCLDPPLKKSPKQTGYGWICQECDTSSSKVSMCTVCACLWMHRRRISIWGLAAVLWHLSSWQYFAKESACVFFLFVLAFVLIWSKL